MNLNTSLTYGPLTLDINFDYSPAEPDVFYLRNGDPGYPGCDAEVSICSITSAQAPGISFIGIFDAMDSELNLSFMSLLEDTCLSAASAQEEYAAAREEAALDDYYESLRNP
jgi:hypothetical protein